MTVDADAETQDQTTIEPCNAEDKKMNETSENTNVLKARDNRDDKLSIHVKQEFILSERPKSLPPLPPEEEQQQDARNTSKKRKRGMNKKRPRDHRIDPSSKMCHAVIKGLECPYGEQCKYSHDMKKMFEERSEDIKEIEGGCPNFELRGSCEFGIMCRVGSSHLDEEGNNIQKEVESTPELVKNVIPKEVTVKLRKKQYPFQCKRHFESNAETMDTSTPLPTKRKLIDFRNKVYIAPLTTVGNLPFRRIMKHFGADITCGEMAVATCLLEGKTTEWALLKRHPCEDIFGIQIAAAHPDQYTRICEVLRNEEFEFDFLDLNLGCPLDLLCEKGAGAKLMTRESKLQPILRGIAGTLDERHSITVKMRTGWDENKPIAHKLVHNIHSWGIPGISAVFVHGRSRLQRYTKLSNWNYINTVASSETTTPTSETSPPIPVIGNGDIFSYTDYQSKLEANPDIFPCAMLARGALIKPWLPTEIKEKRHWDISATERFDYLKEFVKFGLEHWGSDEQGVNTTRRFLLEWLSFLYRYVPVGMLEVLPQQMNHRPPTHLCGRNDLETLMLSKHCRDWIKISEMLLGPVADDFQFQPKHKANGY